MYVYFRLQVTVNEQLAAIIAHIEDLEVIFF
jgi:hypothetical protein